MGRGGGKEEGKGRPGRSEPAARPVVGEAAREEREGTG